MGNKLFKLPSEIDLIVASQAEYDFLRFVDQHPTLYSTSVLQNALYRYEKYWLPLAANHDGNALRAPLDIQWIWHCHILTPDYRKDCEKIVNKIVDYSPMVFIGKDEGENESRSLWEQKYPQVPYDADLGSNNPVLLCEDGYVRKSTCDLISVATHQRIFNYSVSLPHYRDKQFLKNAMARYSIMLSLMLEHPEKTIFPCYDVDLVWRAHRLFVLQYHEDMLSVLGNLPKQNTLIYDRTPGSTLQENIATTKKLWEGKGKPYAVPGCMFRNEPSLPEMQNYSDDLLKIVNKTYEIIFRDMKIYHYAEPDENGDVAYFQILKAVAPGGNLKGVNLFGKVPLKSSEDNALSYSFSEDAYTLDSSQHNGLIIYCHQGTSESSAVLSLPQLFPDTHNICSISLNFENDKNENVGHGILQFEYAELSIGDYAFSIHELTRTVRHANHMKTVLDRVEAISQSVLFLVKAPCEYIDNLLQTNIGQYVFTWRTVHCQNPALSAVEILNHNGSVVATAHTIGSYLLPNKTQISDPSKAFTHNPSIERAMLIRGKKGDWGILKSSWYGFRLPSKKSKGRLGYLEVSLFLINGSNSAWHSIQTLDIHKYTQFDWNINGGKGFLDIESGLITIAGCVQEVSEYICMACAIAVSFVLCQPRPPPPAKSKPYPTLAKKDRLLHHKLHVDSMPFLVAAGLYANLPRWYHASHRGEYIYQIPPQCIQPCQKEFWGDFGYIFDSEDRYTSVFYENKGLFRRKSQWDVKDSNQNYSSPFIKSDDISYYRGIINPDDDSPSEQKNSGKCDDRNNANNNTDEDFVNSSGNTQDTMGSYNKIFNTDDQKPIDVNLGEQEDFNDVDSVGENDGVIKKDVFGNDASGEDRTNHKKDVETTLTQKGSYDETQYVPEAFAEGNSNKLQYLDCLDHVVGNRDDLDNDDGTVVEEVEAVNRIDNADSNMTCENEAPVISDDDANQVTNSSPDSKGEFKVVNVDNGSSIFKGNMNDTGQKVGGMDIVENNVEDFRSVRDVTEDPAAEPSIAEIEKANFINQRAGKESVDVFQSVSDVGQDEKETNVEVEDEDAYGTSLFDEDTTLGTMSGDDQDDIVITNNISEEQIQDVNMTKTEAGTFDSDQEVEEKDLIEDNREDDEHMIDVTEDSNATDGDTKHSIGIENIHNVCDAKEISPFLNVKDSGEFTVESTYRNSKLGEDFGNEIQNLSYDIDVLNDKSQDKENKSKSCVAMESTGVLDVVQVVEENENEPVEDGYEHSSKYGATDEDDSNTLHSVSSISFSERGAKLGTSIGSDQGNNLIKGNVPRKHIEDVNMTEAGTGSIVHEDVSTRDSALFTQTVDIPTTMEKPSDSMTKEEILRTNQDAFTHGDEAIITSENDQTGKKTSTDDEENDQHVFSDEKAIEDNNYKAVEYMVSDLEKSDNIVVIDDALHERNRNRQSFSVYDENEITNIEVNSKQCIVGDILEAKNMTTLCQDNSISDGDIKILTENKKTETEALSKEFSLNENDHKNDDNILMADEKVMEVKSDGGTCKNEITDNAHEEATKEKVDNITSNDKEYDRNSKQENHGVDKERKDLILKVNSIATKKMELPKSVAIDQIIRKNGDGNATEDLSNIDSLKVEELTPFNIQSRTSNSSSDAMHNIFTRPVKGYIDLDEIYDERETNDVIVENGVTMDDSCGDKETVIIKDEYNDTLDTKIEVNNINGIDRHEDGYPHANYVSKVTENEIINSMLEDPCNHESRNNNVDFVDHDEAFYMESTDVGNIKHQCDKQTCLNGKCPDNNDHSHENGNETFSNKMINIDNEQLNSGMFFI
ncbi:uncharacterized protein LOC130644674 [Hydractinia symbiolongicarpus]|uniref:uncharacterized protein LOC130644674 n=1 Tax=Hydractinia symbiolongicarpus TaxID=13093 RepID=UPI00254F2238|nr:uncharacterized protein LOC130644674 [Hydractinia symbiolongicarpus]